MSDSCGLWAHDGRDTTRAGVLGDLLWDFEKVEAKTPAGSSVQMGICEGHGGGVIFEHRADGTWWLVHAPLEHGEPRELPEPTLIPVALRR
jgi:hypothetical protein